MKKVMSFLAIAAMVLVASCNKNPKHDPKPTPEPEPEPEYVAPITIDGDFADWAKLDASKVAVTTCNPDSKLLALKTVKAYADEQFIFLYVEVKASDKEQQRMMRHRENRKDKEYRKHHKEIQDKKTRKKMKKDKKKSEAYNHHKPPLKSKRAAKKRDRKR